MREGWKNYHLAIITDEGFFSFTDDSLQVYGNIWQFHISLISGISQAGSQDSMTISLLNVDSDQYFGYCGGKKLHFHGYQL